MATPLKLKKSQNRVGIYARISTHDQKTLSLQLLQMRKYAKDRGWKVIVEVQDIGSGASTRPKRAEVMSAARKRMIDTVIVWKLDRWGRSVVDLVTSFKELTDLGVGFVSLTEALDLNTPTGRAMTGLLAVFAEFERDSLKERVKAGIAQARNKGQTFGRPKSAALKFEQVVSLKKKGSNNTQISKRLEIGRTSVRRALSCYLAYERFECYKLKMASNDYVLFVEDDRDLADLFALTVEDLSLQYLVAQSKYDLDEKLAELKKNNANVTKILMDMNVIGLNLTTSVPMLKNNFATSAAEIILVSGDNKIEKVASDLGIKRFLKKPFDYDQLLAILAD